MQIFCSHFGSFFCAIYIYIYCINLHLYYIYFFLNRNNAEDPLDDKSTLHQQLDQAREFLSFVTCFKYLNLFIASQIFS